VWPAEEEKRKTDFCRNLFFISLLKEVAGGKQLRLEGYAGEKEDSEKSAMPRN